MKLILTAGEDANGNVHLLYLGKDAEHALKALENPPAGIVRTAMFKKPNWDKRRHFPENGNAAPVAPAAPEAPETVIDPGLLDDSAESTPRNEEAKPETDEPLKEQPKKQARRKA